MPDFSSVVPFPAPYGGMNTRDGLAALQPYEARFLKNLLPIGNAVTVRRGNVLFSDSLSIFPVSTLYAYEGVSESKLVGLTNQGDVWSFLPGTGAGLGDTSYVNKRMIMENYGNRLIGVGAGNEPFVYDGTTFSTATGFTGDGLTLTHLSNIAKVRNRLWFCETNSADVWYGPLGGITGTLTKFQLSQVVSGGFCAAICQHSQDAGDGPDDMTVFVMSTGEVVVYSGDPSSTFSKIGNFRLPAPFNFRCTVQVGGEAAILTRMGLVPVGACFQGIAFDPVSLGPFGKIAPTLQELATSYHHFTGWEMVYYNGAVIINIPTSARSSMQALYNVLTGTWTTLDLPISCMAVMDGELYFGDWRLGRVYKYDTYLDGATPIRIESRGAFQGTKSNAVCSMLRFDVRIEGYVSGRFGVDVNYTNKKLTPPDEIIAAAVVTTPWGSPWGHIAGGPFPTTVNTQWNSSTDIEPLWFSTEGEGRGFAVALEGSVEAPVLEWYSTDLLLEVARRVG